MNLFFIVIQINVSMYIKVFVKKKNCITNILYYEKKNDR